MCTHLVILELGLPSQVAATARRSAAASTMPHHRGGHITSLPVQHQYYTHGTPSHPHPHTRIKGLFQNNLLQSLLDNNSLFSDHYWTTWLWIKLRSSPLKVNQMAGGRKICRTCAFYVCDMQRNWLTTGLSMQEILQTKESGTLSNGPKVCTSF